MPVFTYFYVFVGFCKQTNNATAEKQALSLTNWTTCLQFATPGPWLALHVFTVHTDVIWDNVSSTCGADWGRTTIKLHSILRLEGESDSLDRVEFGGVIESVQESAE